jgi:hypothetical protein
VISYGRQDRNVPCQSLLTLCILAATLSPALEQG